MSLSNELALKNNLHHKSSLPVNLMTHMMSQVLLGDICIIWSLKLIVFVCTCSAGTFSREMYCQM